MKNKLIKTIFVFVFMFIGVCNVKAETRTQYCLYKSKEYDFTLGIIYEYNGVASKYAANQGGTFTVSDNIRCKNCNIVYSSVEPFQKNFKFKASDDASNDVTCPSIEYRYISKSKYVNLCDPSKNNTNCESITGQRTDEATFYKTGVDYRSEDSIEEGNVYCSYEIIDSAHDINSTLGIKYNKKSVSDYNARNMYQTTLLETRFYGSIKLEENFGTLLKENSTRNCPSIHIDTSSDTLKFCSEENAKSDCSKSNWIMSGKEISEEEYKKIKDGYVNKTVGDKAECTYDEGDYSIIINFSVSGSGQLKQVKIASDSDIKVTGSISEITNEFGTLSTNLDPSDSCPEICSYYTDESNTSIAIKRKANLNKECSEIYSDGKDYTKLTGHQSNNIHKTRGNDPDDPPEEGVDLPLIGTGDPISCKEMLGEKGVSLLKGAFLLIKIAAPLLFILLSMIDFMGGITSDNPESARNKAFSNMKIRAIACALLYNLPLLIKVAFDLLGVIELDNCGVW